MKKTGAAFPVIGEADMGRGGGREGKGKREGGKREDSVTLKNLNRCLRE